MEELEALLGADNHAVADLRQLFSLAAAYGYADWLVFDASVVRGLAYYTGGCWQHLHLLRRALWKPQWVCTAFLSLQHLPAVTMPTAAAPPGITGQAVVPLLPTPRRRGVRGL